ncbi:cytochrome c55X [Inhella inkyongensis]|uniref:Cytochrome c55X n=1 Tax=Inhella inkyongensis TaxID=392593 RepID=A0A840S5E5_9BURK|nr:cytochrome c [Inhella inkyongensis]MBB5204698.1 cytochrome c55X [Inhella inkyongensis]
MRLAPTLLLLIALPAWAQEPAPARQQQLIRMLRQDCGSCHGMKLTGGLGPALTREALAERPLESMAATIFYGRPGTPMPGWRGLMTEDEAAWMARLLRAGAPEEPPAKVKP